MRDLDQWVELCEWAISRSTRRVRRADAPAHLRHLFNSSRRRVLEAKALMVCRHYNVLIVRKDWRERLEALKNDSAIFGCSETGKV